MHKFSTHRWACGAEIYQQRLSVEEEVECEIERESWKSVKIDLRIVWKIPMLSLDVSYDWVNDNHDKEAMICAICLVKSDDFTLYSSALCCSSRHLSSSVANIAMSCVIFFLIEWKMNLCKNFIVRLRQTKERGPVVSRRWKLILWFVRR